MSERKVLQKYYPADFDPSAITRSRKPKNSGPRIQPVRLMAPFSMKCTSCGEYIHKGRKFNARKETPDDERYLGLQIFRFYIRCTRCSAEITFRTDPKNQDYLCERGAKRSVEVWAKPQEEREETDEERLDRLQREEDEEEEAAKQDKMVQLEAKRDEAKREMAVGDALDEIRMRNARMEVAQKEGVEFTVAPSTDDEARLAEEREDEEAARRAFAFAKEQQALVEEVADDDGWTADERGVGVGMGAQNSNKTTDMPPPPRPMMKTASAVDDTAITTAPSFKRQAKKKKDHAGLLGIKKKPALV